MLREIARNKFARARLKIAMMWAAMLAPLIKLHQRRPVMGTAAFVALSPVVAIVGSVLTVIIVVLVLAALAPDFFSAAADITGALTTADLNNSLANTIAGIVAILVPLVLLFGFVALIFAAARMGKKGR